MTTPIDAQQIMDEIQRLAVEHRRRLSGDVRPPAEPASIDLALLRSADCADLQAPVLVPHRGWRRWLLSTLDRLRRRSLQAVLIRQSTVNRALIDSLQQLAARIDLLQQRIAALDAATPGRDALTTLPVRRELEARAASASPSSASAASDAHPASSRLATAARADETAMHERRRFYVDCFGPPAAEGTILDVSCGRGEVLGWLSAAGHAVRAVDPRPEHVTYGRAQGLSVTEAGAVPYLLSLPAGSLAGIVAAQLVDHLSLDSLTTFVRACHRTLRPGGRVVLESANTDSLGTWRTFYADLTRHRPIPPAAMRSLLEASGFDDIAFFYLNPVPSTDAFPAFPGDSPLHDQLNAAFDKLNQLLFGAQDYAAVATR